MAKADRLSEALNDLINEGVRKELLNVVREMAEKPGQIAVAITAIIGRAKSTIERFLKVLRSLDVIEFKGAPKTGGYFLTAFMQERVRLHKQVIGCVGRGQA